MWGSAEKLREGEGGRRRGATGNRLPTTGLQSLKDKGLGELGRGLLILPDTLSCFGDK